jgi:hypothetical protein
VSTILILFLHDNIRVSAIYSISGKLISYVFINKIKHAHDVAEQGEILILLFKSLYYDSTKNFTAIPISINIGYHIHFCGFTN